MQRADTFLKITLGGGGRGGRGPSCMLCPPSSQFLATPLLIGIAVPGVIAYGPCLVDVTSGRRPGVGSVTGQPSDVTAAACRPPLSDGGLKQQEAGVAGQLGHVPYGRTEEVGVVCGAVTGKVTRGCLSG